MFTLYPEILPNSYSRWFCGFFRISCVDQCVVCMTVLTPGSHPGTLIELSGY